MIGQLFEKDVFKIMTLFSLSPGSRLNRNEIKEATRLNNVPLDNALTKLLNNQILIRTRNYYQINFENDNSKILLGVVSKQHKQMKELPLNVYFLLIDLADYLNALKGLDVYLFGSYSKLIYHNKSDVDIAIITPKDLDKGLISKITSKLEKKYQKEIQVHDFLKESFYKNTKDPLIKDIIKNGMKIL